MKLASRIQVGMATVLLAFVPALFAQGADRQTVNVMGPMLALGSSCLVAGTRALVAENGATLIRTKTGISVAVTMPTPAPGTFCYPPANAFQTVQPVPGTPEVFTGWAFVFNYPAYCTPASGGSVPVCDSDDLGPTAAAKGGVYNFAGHAISGGGNLNLVGHISVGEARFGGNFNLENPAGAEVHAAVAPHGVLVPDLLPEQINTPVGSPPYWWLAVFFAPSP